MSQWHWIRLDVVLAIHGEQLADHGGKTGVRNLGLLQSALARPITMAGYNQCDAATLAAAYAFGLVRNHPFIDGHKRVAWTTARTFLLLHGHDVQASDTDKVLKVLALADGALSEAEFADWLRRGLTPI